MAEKNKGAFVLDEICEFLETYKGRDKILRTLCYTTKLIGGLVNNEKTARKFFVFSSQMSKTRAVLRLLDDLPMLKYNLEYGFGREEPDSLMASLGVVTNIVDQVYYPIEKMSWLAEHNLIEADGSKWDVLSSIFWVASIYLTLMRSMRYLNVLQTHKRNNHLNEECRVQMVKLLHRQKLEMLTCVRLCLDLVHAVNTLPAGFLWSSKLNSWQVGLVASVSSFLGIYQMFAKKCQQ